MSSRHVLLNFTNIDRYNLPTLLGKTREELRAMVVSDLNTNHLRLVWLDKEKADL